MKVTLDLSKLLEDKRITPEEAERLKALAMHGAGTLGINILVGFGVVAVAAGAGALVPSAMTAVVLGAALFAAGLFLTLTHARQWDLLAQILTLVGALALAGGILVLDQGSLRAAITVTAGLAIAAAVARSSLLAALAVFSLASCFGARAGYLHAMYSLSISEPTLTIVVFSALALKLYILSKWLSADYERVAIAGAQTSVFLVNFGFWIGSLWGDVLPLIRSLIHGDPAIRSEYASKAPVIPPYVFSISWALALIALAVWALRANRLWVVNVVAVFGAIHFYTQWFDKLGANPGSVLAAGLLMLAFALGLWTFNRRAGGLGLSS